MSTDNYSEGKVYNREIIRKYNVAMMNLVADCIQYNDAGHWDDADCMKEFKVLSNRFSASIIIEPATLPVEDLIYLGFQRCNVNLFLIPMYLWNCIPNGTELYGVDDVWYIKGVNTEKLPDTRFGMTAYGVHVVTYDNYDGS